MRKKNTVLLKRAGSIAMVFALSMSSISGFIPKNTKVTQAAENSEGGGTKIENDSLSVQIGDLGQIAVMNIKNNRKNSLGKDVNFVLPNDTLPQNDVQHQWMGEMIFSYRTSANGSFPEDNTGFVEVDTNKTLAVGGSTTASDIAPDNPYIEKNVVSDKKIEVTYKGLTSKDIELATEGDVTEVNAGEGLQLAAKVTGSETQEESNLERAMKGFNVSSVYDMETDDGSLLWNITLENTSKKYIEFGDVGLPMPWNNKYVTIENTYNNCVTAHTFAGADSGYAYAIRCSGEGNYMLFTPVVESGARIEYVDNWLGVNGLDQSTIDHRADDTFKNWTIDSGGWPAGLSVYYIHSKDIQKTGRGYYTDATSLILQPGEKKTYQFKFSAVRAGDNTPQNSADDYNNSSDLMQERENNLHSILYKSGMIDAIAVPGFQTAINMDTQLDLHYDEEKIKDVSIDIQCVHENDPYDEKHIPIQKEGLVNNSRTGRGTHNGNENYSESCELKETKVVDGESHHIYNLKFGCIGNNSVRVNYKLNVDGTYVDKFTEFEFNVLTEIKDLVNAHSDFMVKETQDTDPNSETFGIYSDWYLASGKDTTQNGHWGDDWSHDNINFITIKNYLDPNPEEVKSIENYLIDFMWENYMKNNHENYVVANYLHQSGVYTDTLVPYNRTFSEVMEATGFYNMYRIEKAYPDLIEYREQPEYYLEKAYNIYINRVDEGAVGFYGEQQIPDMIESLKKEGMTEEAERLKERFAKNKGTNVLNADYPYGSEFEYDNTGEEGAYAAAKSLLKYYPNDVDIDKVKHSLDMTEWKTRAMRGIQPTWYQYADPVFRAGESWWNFQYTASLAGSIMDDNLKYQNNDSDYDRAWAARVNYAAKLSNFNAVNMGQISDKYVGSVSWRYNMYKSGNGTINVNDGGTRVMNNGWNDFSGESEEGLYGSLLRISSDVVGDDPIFGLVGYGCQASKSNDNYTVTPQDGIGKRINLIDEKVYVELVQDKCTSAVISKDGTSFKLKVEPSVSEEHISQINLSGAGIASGYYSITVDGKEAGQVYVNNNHEGSAYASVSGNVNSIVITKMSSGENTAPTVDIVEPNAGSDGLQAKVAFQLRGIAYDDGVQNSLTYKWTVEKKPDGGNVTLSSDTKPFTTVKATVEGEYTLKLTVSDGEKSSEKEIILNIGAAPERKAPEITSIEGEQDAINTTIANLTGEAKADPIYEGTLSYEWTVEEQPQGSNAVIADANTQNAVLKVDKSGDYVIRLTVTDADKISYKDIIITMNDKADGIWRDNPIITQLNTAPQLPDSMKVINANGEYQEGTVSWDEITSDKYAQVGEFEVTGTMTGIKVGVKVCVVSGKSQNVALFATPSGIIDDVADLGGVKGLNDGYDPTSSRDTSHGVWHNWRGGAQGDPAWVMYTWENPIAIYATDAYYYSDGNFKPKTVFYEYLDSEGNWREVPNAKGLGVELNQYNHTDFAPVITKCLRMTMTPEKLGCGVIEWKVSGYSEQIFVDKKSLEAQISKAQGLDMSLFEDGTKETLEAAIEQAQSVLDNKDATQEEVDAAIEELGKVMANLSSKNGNLAYVAQVSTSFVSAWEKLESINDGKLDGAHYGSWGNNSAAESVTYTWGTKVKTKGMDIYFWSDGGGILYPASYVCEYLDDSGNWIKMPNISEIESNKSDDTWHIKVSFDETTTTAVRLTMNKQEADGNGVGLWEWEVYDSIDENATNELKNLALDSNITVFSALEAASFSAMKIKAVSRKASIDTTDNQKVNWQVTGNTAEGTSIDTNGYLTVDEQEKAESIKVKAVLKEDSTCTSEIALKVIPKKGSSQKKTLKVKNIVVEDKIYDTTKNATIKEITFEGATDNENISYTAEALFESAKAAENAKVTVVITLTGNSSENYILESNTIETTATIKKANPEYTLPENLTAKEGQTLKDVTLPKGFAFKDDLTTSVGTEGKHEFEVIYTPEDTENYNIVTDLKIVITVTKSGGNIDIGAGNGSENSGSSGNGSGSGSSGNGSSGNGGTIIDNGNNDNNDNNNNDNNTTNPTQPDKEPEKDNNTQTVTETKPDGTTITTVTETAQNGDIKETKTVTINDNTSVLTIEKETTDGQKETNAVINAGSQEKVVISTKFLEILAEDKDVDKYTVEIVSATVNAAPKKTKNTVVEISIPVVNGVSMEKVVCTKDGIEAAKQTGKGLKIIVTMIKEDGSSESSVAGIENGGYVATIPAKQLAKIDSSVESVDFAISVVGQKKLSENSIDKTLKTKLTKSGSNAKKTCVISTIENNAIKDVGMNFKIDVVNNTNNVDLQAGNTVYLYKYNNSTKKFEEMAYSKQVVAKDGTINISGYSDMKYIVSSKKLSGNSVTTIKQGISLKANKNTVKKGNKLSLKLTLPDTVSTKKEFGTEKATVVYKSKKPDVATVSKNGVIKAKGKGKVTVTAVIKLSSGRKITKKKQVTVK